MMEPLCAVHPTTSVGSHSSTCSSRFRRLRIHRSYALAPLGASRDADPLWVDSSVPWKGNGNREDPMQMAARMVQDDLAIMFEKEDGQMYLLAGAILLPGFWRLQDKLGMSLDELHYRYALSLNIVRDL